MNLLELVYEYQTLYAREFRLAIPLDADERARFLGLGRLLRGEIMGRDAPAKMVRLPTPVPVQLTVPGGFSTGELRSVSARGMALMTQSRLRVGGRTIIQLVEPESMLEYVFPARVVWSAKNDGHGLGIAFDGVPTRSAPLVPRTFAPMSLPTFGEPRDVPMLA